MGRSGSIWRSFACWLVVILTPLAACARQPHADLEHYVHVELPRVADAEHELEAPTSGARGLAPAATRYVRALEEIRPATPEVRALHTLKLEAARTQADALALFSEALAHGDGSLGNRARERFELARVQRLAFEQQLRALESAHDVKP
jgi:hypothetical protein